MWNNDIQAVNGSTLKNCDQHLLSARSIFGEDRTRKPGWTEPTPNIANAELLRNTLRDDMS